MSDNQELFELGVQSKVGKMGVPYPKPTKSLVDLQLSLEVLKYENSVLKRDLETNFREMRRLKRRLSATKPEVEIEIDSNSKLHEVIKQKYIECECYKQQIDQIRKNSTVIPGKAVKRLIPVTSTCNSSKVDMDESRSPWSPVTSEGSLETCLETVKPPSS